ncbi:helix-turn-helix domain-containing protein [Kineococcus sp. SYSU DK005]|uniref:helix-turn-helix domain-containing protein n=1 Tax=Kineococcus sp. SYSU DK005 TaxID=3383126 RepID=UPI003D7C9B43
MRGYDGGLTVGERVAWYRRQRGLSQEVLAGLVGRTTDWLSKVENGRAALYRLSVISQLAEALDVSLGDLIGDPQLMEWAADTRHQTIPALRKALLSYAALLPVSGAREDAPADLMTLSRDVADLWDAYQASRFGYVTARLPRVLHAARAAVDATAGRDRAIASAQLAMTYQVAASTLTKVGETELAWICADRGLMAAERSEDLTIVGSLLRSVAHALLSNAQYADALAVIDSGLTRLQPTAGGATPPRLSMIGSLLLVAAMAAARTDDRREARARLALVEQHASRIGADTNHLWSAFGPTNVAVHRVSVAMEVGDVQIAADLGPRVDTRALPVERRVRHSLEVARAFTALNRPDEALGILLSAEQDAPEQVRYHFLSRELVLSWIRGGRLQASGELRHLAERLRVA